MFSNILAKKINGRNLIRNEKCYVFIPVDQVFQFNLHNFYVLKIEKTKLENLINRPNWVNCFFLANFVKKSSMLIDVVRCALNASDVRNPCRRCVIPLFAVGQFLSENAALSEKKSFFLLCATKKFFVNVLPSNVTKREISL